MTIGKSIEKCRERKGISRKKLTELSGVTYLTLYYWEHDKATPRIDLLICVADVLGITLDELVGRTV